MRSDPHDPNRRPRGPFSRFRRNRSGSVAVEFSLLAIPFCLLVFAILESCISFASQQVLANATDDVARLLRTGQLKKADATDAKIRSLICGKLEIMVASGCPGLEFDLRKVETFAEAAQKAKIEISGGKIVGTGTVTPGLSMSKNILRTFYRWPVMTDFMRKSMSNMDDQTTLHFASVTWQNEPFDD